MPNLNLFLPGSMESHLTAFATFVKNVGRSECGKGPWFLDLFTEKPTHLAIDAVWQQVPQDPLANRGPVDE